jgi:hypothetical protein
MSSSSANVLTAVVLVALVLAAAALRIAAGPIVAHDIVADGRGASLYALGKTGPEPDPLLASVELAASDAKP